MCLCVCVKQTHKATQTPKSSHINGKKRDKKSDYTYKRRCRQFREQNEYNYENNAKEKIKFTYSNVRVGLLHQYTGPLAHSGFNFIAMSDVKRGIASTPMMRKKNPIKNLININNSILKMIQIITTFK